MKKLFTLVVLAFIGIYTTSACTTVVVSGKYTEDGRPLLWKLRDTDYFENKMMHFEGNKYTFTGLINSEDEKGEQVWGGMNTEGFGIMNSASFNLRMNDKATFTDQEGIIMKKALGECKTLEDFENMLLNLPKPWGLEANFGVIDAFGGAAYYETNDTAFVRFDANDPTHAPNGYIIRSNYSYTGTKDVGYGFIRYQTAQELMNQWDAAQEINMETLVGKAPRSLRHSLMQTDYAQVELKPNKAHHFVNSGDLMTRQGTASSIVLHGVKEDQDPKEAVTWVNVAYPLTCVSVPVFTREKDVIPEVLKAPKDKNCWLNEKAMELKDLCYPVKRSAGYKYLDLVPLFGEQNLYQKYILVEKNIFNAYYDMQGDYSEKSIKELNHYINLVVRAAY